LASASRACRRPLRRAADRGAGLALGVVRQCALRGSCLPRRFRPPDEGADAGPPGELRCARRLARDRWDAAARLRAREGARCGPGRDSHGRRARRRRPGPGRLRRKRAAGRQSARAAVDSPRQGRRCLRRHAAGRRRRLPADVLLPDAVHADGACTTRRSRPASPICR
jgi:hypothetical protein